jgi:hypothetical protein
MEIFIAPAFETNGGAADFHHMFRATIDGTRVANPENHDGFISATNVSGEELPLVAPSIVSWYSPKQPQEQFNRRLADISSLAEPVHAKFPEFLGNFAKNKVLVFTIDLSPAETGCFSSWALVLIPGGRKMAFAEDDDPTLTKEQATICGLLAALSWECPREKDPDPTLWAPRTILYPMEIAELMHNIRNGQSNLIPDYLAGACGDIAVMTSGWERNVGFKLYSHEEALALDSNVASWIQFAQNAALRSHTYILEDVRTRLRDD